MRAAAKLGAGGYDEMRGRKPKPTVLKLIEGNPGKRRINEREPVPPLDLPECPEFLNEEARAEGRCTAPVLAAMGLLTQADRTALSAYCVAYSRWVQAEAQVERYGEIPTNTYSPLDEVAVHENGEIPFEPAEQTAQHDEIEPTANTVHTD